MTTPDEMRAMAEVLESLKADFKNCDFMIHPTLFNAARMLRSIAAERDAEQAKTEVVHLGNIYRTCDL